MDERQDGDRICHVCGLPKSQCVEFLEKEKSDAARALLPARPSGCEAAGRGRKRVRLYLSGPITHDDVAVVNARALASSDAAAILTALGYSVYAPQATAASSQALHVAYDSWMDADFDWLGACDWIVLLPGWEQSKGARLELAEARRLGLPVWRYLPPLATQDAEDAYCDAIGVERRSVFGATELPQLTPLTSEEEVTP